MGDASAIEWTDATWNPIVGCSIVSPGCSNCYAMRQAARIQRMAAGAGKSSHYEGTTQASKAGPVWTGKLAPAPDHILTQPLRWARPRRIFVNSMSDLFHEGAPVETIDRVFAVMALTPQHEYQVLTKRSDRMLAYVSAAWQRRERLGEIMGELGGEERAGWYAPESDGKRGWISIALPLPNVLLGTSVEDQRRADERKGDMQALAAAGWRTFVSYEPALGPVDWAGWEFLSWLISGGESGPRARPSHPDWHRAARDFCAAHRIPYFFKQWGEWADGSDFRTDCITVARSGRWWPSHECAPSDIANRWSDMAPCMMHHAGKRAAGRLLDGIEHNAMPAGYPNG